ncbi:extracellular solute-binding protein [Paenibacillus piri]|uniref:Extracellular solute-binding protein n=1 Tax=Paenibacillus piri TaxID=2547395 RepID=A0A4R5K8E7_9BACL|nr:extracellular solute-binding protein [Paenibacillus piri]TDF91226.1 extracellular solute-binding protein [Paenibacillus piri]
MAKKGRGRNNGCTALSAVLLMAVLTGACSNSEAGKGGAQDGNKPQADKPFEISIMTTFRGAEPPGKDNPIGLELEKQLNAKLNITWLSANNYSDKMNVTLASGDMPDLMLVENPMLSNIISTAKQGAFWDLTSKVKDYPNLMAFPKDSWENIKIEGKIYGIPRARPEIGGYGIPMLRKDWLDKLNLKVPETMDDLYKVLKAFTEQDPDGNGKNDTIGFSGYVDADGLGRFTWVRDVFNQANGWKVDGNQIIHPDVLPGTRDALVWLNRLYKEGLMSQDFAVMKLSQMKDQLKAGKAGMFSESMQQSWIMLNDLRKLESKADYLPLNYVQGPGGKFVGRDSGHFGMYVIPKKVSEARVNQILALMDKGSSEPVSDIANFGIKGVHYNETDGMKISTEQAFKDNVSQEVFGQIFLFNDKYMRGYATGIPKDYFDRNKSIIDERSKYSVANPSLNLISDTGVKYMPEFNKKSQDLKTKIIMGSEPIEAWDQFTAKLKTDDNFQKYVKEMNEAYQKANGK